MKVTVIAEMNNLFVDTILTILFDWLNLSNVSVRWIPRMLTAPQKQMRVECYSEFLEVCGKNPSSIFEKNVTKDEAWIRH